MSIYLIVAVVIAALLPAIKIATEALGAYLQRKYNNGNSKITVQTKSGIRIEFKTNEDDAEKLLKNIDLLLGK